MRRFAIILIMLMSSVAYPMWYGEHDIGDYLTFAVNTSQFSTGAGYDSVSVPQYGIYEDETAAEVVGPAAMAKLDDAGTIGFYTERVQLTEANFDVGKMYTIYITATVDGVAATTYHAFKMRVTPIATAVALATVDTNVDDIETDTSSTLDTLIKDIPTVAEFEARSIVAANYVVVGDTIAAVTLLNGLAANVITTASINDGAITDAKIATIGVNMIQISGDSGAADNLELTYDGSGYTNDVAPATQSQLDQIALTGSAVSTPAKDSPNGFTIVWGEAEANTEDSTHAADDVYHDIEAQNDTGTEKIDVYYEFAIGGDGVPTTASWEGLLDKGGGAAKNITVQAYNWSGSAWDQIGSITSSNNDVNETFTMYTSHVGTGANIGLVRIKFVTGSVAFTATTKLRTDQIFVSYAIVVRTVGYDKGAVWINTNASNTNTESFVDGTADNPVSTIAAATTIAGNLGLKHFEIVAGSSITLAQAYASYTFAGDNWTLALDSQVINNTLIIGADVTGICTGTSPHFFDCDFGSATLPGSTLRRCSFGGTITFNDVDDYFFDQCYSAIAGIATPDIDFGGAIGSTNLSMRHYSGGIEIKNLGGTGTDKLSLEGWGQLIINSSSDAGTIAIRGSFTITDNAPGGFSGTLSENARYDTGQINAEADSALADYDGPTNTEMIARTLTAADYFLFATDPVELRSSGGGANTNAEEFVNLIWDEPRGAHTTGNTFGGDALDNDTWTDARAAYLDELAAANLPTDIAAIPTVAEIWQTDISAYANTAQAGGILIWMFNVGEGDEYIDTTTTPWQLVRNKKGTPGTEYLRKNLFDVSGGNITSIATVIGKLTEP